MFEQNYGWATDVYKTVELARRGSTVVKVATYWSWNWGFNPGPGQHEEKKYLRAIRGKRHRRL
jgi:hypothetical protein